MQINDRSEKKLKRQQQLQIEKATPCNNSVDCSDIGSSSNQSTARIERKLKNLKKQQGIHGLVGCHSKHCQGISTQSMDERACHLESR